MEMTEERNIHVWFELSYSNYLVLARSLLQSMPDNWQIKFVKLLEELDESFDLPPEYTGNYWVRMRDGNKFVADPFRDYQRGRRVIPLKPKETTTCPEHGEVEEIPVMRDGAWHIVCPICGVDTNPKDSTGPPHHFKMTNINGGY